MGKCELRKRFEWCADVEPGCSAIIDKCGIDTEKTEAFCKSLSLQLLPKYRYLKYIDNLVNISNIPTEQIVILKQLGFSTKDISELLNTREDTIKSRLSGTKKSGDERKDVLANIVEYGTKNTLRSLESKWTQLNEMRQSEDEDVQLKAIKLQVDIEGLINAEKDRALSMDKLKNFMSMMENKVIEADRRLRNEIDRINKIIFRTGGQAIEYVSITKDIRRAIESDKELLAVNEAMCSKEVIDVSTQRTRGEATLID